MKSISTLFAILLIVFALAKGYAQHDTKINVEVNIATKTLNIQQEITFINTTGEVLNSIILNDWMHAYSSKTTDLANRFSDEFYRDFHLAAEKERGSTNNLIIIDDSKLSLIWNRPEANSDYLKVSLRNK